MSTIWDFGLLWSPSSPGEIIRPTRHRPPAVSLRAGCWPFWGGKTGGGSRGCQRLTKGCRFWRVARRRGADTSLPLRNARRGATPHATPPVDCRCPTRAPRMPGRAAGTTTPADPATQRVSFAPVMPSTPVTAPGAPSTLPAPPQGIPATLRLPPGEGRVPAVVIVHGSGGVDGRGAFYAEALRRAGIATIEPEHVGRPWDRPPAGGPAASP